jgi:hypothetical protein
VHQRGCPARPEEDHSDRLRDAILGLSDPNHPLVAVVGMGSSFVGTEQMARALSAPGHSNGHRGRHRTIEHHHGKPRLHNFLCIG